MAKEKETPVIAEIVVEAPEIVAPVQPPAAEPINTEPAEHMIPKSRLDEEIKAKKQAEKELQKFLDAEKQHKDADLSDLEKANKHAAELDAELKAVKRREMQREAIDKVKLPAEFADRLRGETPEEMEEDAKKLLAAIPKQATLTPTNAGTGTGAVTDAQRRGFLFQGGDLPK